MSQRSSSRTLQSCRLLSLLVCLTGASSAACSGDDGARAAQVPTADGSGASVVPDAGTDAGMLEGSSRGDAGGVDAAVWDASPAEDPTVPDARISADAAGTEDASASAPDAAAMQPIDPPVPDDCITDVSPGDHTFTCGGITFLVWVDEKCTKLACGLIFDVHGGSMGGAQMRDNTHLHELAPPEGYLVVHPSATPDNTGGSWDLQSHPPVLGEFMDRMIEAFHVDPKRIHVTGFSQGSAVTFWFLCHKPELLASAAPVSGASAADVLAPDGSNCIESIAAGWPRSPILFMNGTRDMALAVADGRVRVNSLVEQLGLTDEGSVAPDAANYRRTRYMGEDGMQLDYIEHDYGGQAVLDGHCLPGGTDVPGSANNFALNATTCTDGDVQIHWGEEALRWFLTHPKR